ncbi:hypothetical protein BJF78_04325 [Pseudonocardia sp. CNS-139]|nr:hypothetical protein BJF78_04325 [Pseudonocardia sp. CNS-139]
MSRILLDLTPLRASPFRAAFAARAVSVVGLGFLIVAVPLQVYELTGSTTGVATITAVVGVSAFAGTLIGGVLADRHDRQRLIVAARAVATAGFAVLALNAVLPAPQLWLIVVCGVVDGMAGGVSGTALTAATPSLVGEDDLPAAGALVALTSDIGAVLGPALGGVLIGLAGIPANYAVCAVTSLVTTLLLTRLPAMAPPPGPRERSTARSPAASGSRAATASWAARSSPAS